MIWERDVLVEGKTYRVVLSDEEQALLAAKTAGRVCIGFWHETGDQSLSAAEYLVDSFDAVDEQYLERVVRRNEGLPWLIGESDRLSLREFMPDDWRFVPHEAEDTEADRVFYTEGSLSSYIHNQYRFYEYGIWAVVRKSDGVLIGKAGITDRTIGGKEELELGYHIFEPYRRQGYAKEACRMIMDEVKKEYDRPLYAVTLPSNESSIRLLKSLGFVLTAQKYSEADPLHLVFVWNCQG